MLRHHSITKSISHNPCDSPTEAHLWAWPHWLNHYCRQAKITVSTYKLYYHFLPAAWAEETWHHWTETSVCVCVQVWLARWLWLRAFHTSGEPITILHQPISSCQIVGTPAGSNTGVSHSGLKLSDPHLSALILKPTLPFFFSKEKKNTDFSRKAMKLVSIFPLWILRIWNCPKRFAVVSNVRRGFPKPSRSLSLLENVTVSSTRLKFVSTPACKQPVRSFLHSALPRQVCMILRGEIHETDWISHFSDLEITLCYDTKR